MRRDSVDVRSRERSEDSISFDHDLAKVTSDGIL